MNFRPCRISKLRFSKISGRDFHQSVARNRFHQNPCNFADVNFFNEKEKVAKNLHIHWTSVLFVRVFPHFVQVNSFAEIEKRNASDDCAHSIRAPVEYGRLPSGRKALVDFVGDAPHGNDNHGQCDPPLRWQFCSHCECDPERQPCKADAVHQFVRVPKSRHLLDCLL